MTKVEIFWVSIPDEVTINDLQKGLSLLDHEELYTFQRFKVDSRKIEFLAGRVLLKTILAQRLHMTPNQIHFRKNPFGKLLLNLKLCSNQFPYFFNLSHTKHLLACTINSEFEIGIDVENVRQCYSDLMPLVFTRSEIEYVTSQPPISQRQAFFKIWTRKEALLKALGKGFQVEPKSLSIPLEGHLSVMENYEFFSFELLGFYLLSVACQKPKGILNKYEINVVNFYDLFWGYLSNIYFTGSSLG